VTKDKLEYAPITLPYLIHEINLCEGCGNFINNIEDKKTVQKGSCIKMKAELDQGMEKISGYPEKQ